MLPAHAAASSGVSPVPVLWLKLRVSEGALCGVAVLCMLKPVPPSLGVLCHELGQGDLELGVEAVLDPK